MTRNTYCQFTVQVPQGKKISLYFLAFGIRQSDNCTMGSLEVRSITH